MYSNNQASRSKSSNIEQTRGSPEILDPRASEMVRTEIFCSGSKDMLGLVKYINHKLSNAVKVVKPKSIFE